MKTIAILLLIFSIGATNAQEKGYLLNRTTIESQCGEIPLINPQKQLATDTLFCERLEYNGDTYEPYSRRILIYDEFGRVTESTYGYYLSDTYRHSIKEKFTYTTFDSLATYHSMIWNDSLGINGEWDNAMFVTYIYNNNKKLIRKEKQFSPLDIQDWKNNRKTTYEYLDNSYLVTKESIEFYNSDTDIWEPYQTYTFTYNQNQQLTEKVSEYSDNNGQTWYYTSRNLYNYDTKSTKTIIEQVHNGDEWRNSWRFTHILNNNNEPDEIIEEMWNYHDSIWDTLIQQKRIFMYNNYGQLTSETYMSKYFEWVNVTKETYEYDQNYLLTGGIDYEWDFNDSIWIADVQCEIKSSKPTLINEPGISFNLKTYPNPATDYINIDLPGISKKGKTQIIDQYGKIVNQFNNIPEKLVYRDCQPVFIS